MAILRTALSVLALVADVIATLQLVKTIVTRCAAFFRSRHTPLLGLTG